MSQYVVVLERADPKLKEVENLLEKNGISETFDFVQLLKEKCSITNLNKFYRYLHYEKKKAQEIVDAGDIHGWQRNIWDDVIDNQSTEHSKIACKQFLQLVTQSEIENGSFSVICEDKLFHESQKKTQVLEDLWNDEWNKLSGNEYDTKHAEYLTNKMKVKEEDFELMQRFFQKHHISTDFAVDLRKSGIWGLYVLNRTMMQQKIKESHEIPLEFAPVFEKRIWHSLITRTTQKNRVVSCIEFLSNVHKILENEESIKMKNQSKQC